MPYPSDILLPVDAKYYSAVDLDHTYSAEFDIIWSFKYKILPLSVNSQYGISTFLTTSSASESYPGHYIGRKPNYLYTLDEYIELEDGGYFEMEDGSGYIVLEDAIEGDVISDGFIIHIAFDSTGLNALSGEDISGVSINDIHNNGSLTIRGYDNNIISNIPLESLSNSFSLSSNTYQTLRFRYSNAYQKLYIHSHDDNSTKYTLLTSIDLDYKIVNIISENKVACGFAFCSPISSSDTGITSTLHLQKFHVEGSSNVESEEIIEMVPLTIPNRISSYTTLTGVSANPL